MQNTATIALLSLLGLLALTIWRIHTGKVTDKFKTAWAAGLLALMISVATDLDAGLGAAVGFAIVIGALGKTFGQGGAGQGAVSGAIGSSSAPGSSSSAGGQPTNPGVPSPSDPRLII